MHLSPRKDSPGTDMGQDLKSTSQGMTKVGGGGGGQCQYKQVSLELASETINKGKPTRYSRFTCMTLLSDCPNYVFPSIILMVK